MSGSAKERLISTASETMETHLSCTYAHHITRSRAFRVSSVNNPRETYADASIPNPSVWLILNAIPL
jgi:hypothetical protein